MRYHMVTDAIPSRVVAGATVPPPVVPAGVIPFDREAWISQRQTNRPKSKTQANRQRWKLKNKRDRQLVENLAVQLASLTEQLETALAGGSTDFDPNDRVSLTAIGLEILQRRKRGHTSN